MRKLKFKPTDKTVGFFNEFSVIDNLSVEEMLNRVLCYANVQEPINAAILLVWYAEVSIDNLNDTQKAEVMLSFISSLICCVINDEFSIDDALEMITLTYKEIITKDNNDNNDEMPIPEKICYGKKIKVQLAPPAMKIKEYSKVRGITVEKAIEQKIEEMSPDNHNIARNVFFRRVVAATITQSQIQVCCTILILSAFLLSDIKDTLTFEQHIEILRNDCAENIEISYKHRRIEELKEKIYRNN